MAAADTSLADAIAAFRRFNRAYTQFLGTLNESYLSTGYSLAEGRVLYELATRPKVQARKIAGALGLDAGYLSRILTKFENAGLVSRATEESDNRASNLLLTARGRAVVRTLNSRADKQAQSILGPLPEDRRAGFINALRTIQQTALGVEPESPPIALRPHRPGDMGLVVQLEGAGYVEQFGWDETFEALVARIVADFLANFDAARERCWIAEMDGRHVGHVFLVRHPDQPEVARLRLLYVHPTARGHGLGRTLVNECIAFAAAAGYRRVTLWTQSILTAAHRIYQAAGFRLMCEEPHHSFGKDLIGQTWELELP
ncbi:MAG TPA: helix-turn-helix domain-containing GNAT family N-acetyltransferase [Bryobacteraceae bacterium]|nr:helix-turn-helix domain-containing GNAT family N-acetyltransferase [Bryobacteraceae bacterium]